MLPLLPPFMLLYGCIIIIDDEVEFIDVIVIVVLVSVLFRSATEAKHLLVVSLAVVQLT